MRKNVAIVNPKLKRKIGVCRQGDVSSVWFAFILTCFRQQGILRPSSAVQAKGTRHLPRRRTGLHILNGDWTIRVPFDCRTWMLSHASPVVPILLPWHHFLFSPYFCPLLPLSPHPLSLLPPSHSPSAPTLSLFSIAVLPSSKEGLCQDDGTSQAGAAAGPVPYTIPTQLRKIP